MRFTLQDHDNEPADSPEPGPEPVDHGALEGVVAHEGGHESGAFPPFDPTFYASQIFWLALIFAGLYLFLSRAALPRIATVIEERKGKIADDLDQAAELKAQADEAVKAYEAALAEAHAKANVIAAETRDALSEEIKAMQAKTDEEIARKTAEAERRIGEAKQAALTHIRDIAAQAARDIVAKLIGAPPSADAARAAVDGAVEARI